MVQWYILVTKHTQHTERQKIASSKNYTSFKGVISGKSGILKIKKHFMQFNWTKHDVPLIYSKEGYLQ